MNDIIIFVELSLGKDNSMDISLVKPVKTFYFIGFKVALKWATKMGPNSTEMLIAVNAQAPGTTHSTSELDHLPDDKKMPGH